MRKKAKRPRPLLDVGLAPIFFDACAETAAGIGHELNNPLAIVAGQAQTLLKNETSPEKRRRLAAILEQTSRAYEMIVDLRAFSRPPKPEATTIDVAKFCEDWARREAERCEENGVRLETAFETSENAASLTTDEAMLAAILNALTKNAVEATGRGGSIRLFAEEVEFAVEKENCLENGERDGSEILDAEKPARYLEIGVEDDGPGATERTRDLLFAPYFSSRQAGRGLGVGLAKARRFAEELGIDLCCENSEAFETGMRWSVYFRI
ncbi:MAG: HAMP domain-containing histidine kinase [Thermoguttaceae bacterium]|nr:HAMP domain-containing histidine kinase [Thermoguttaceae bacterium]